MADFLKDLKTDSLIPDSNNILINNWAVHQLHTTCHFAPDSKIFSWFIGRLNYQVVHHLFPNISHVHYKNLAKIVEETAYKYQLPYHVNKTFWGALYQHALMLKSLGKPKNKITSQLEFTKNKKLSTV